MTRQETVPEEVYEELDSWSDLRDHAPMYWLAFMLYFVVAIGVSVLFVLAEAYLFFVLFLAWAVVAGWAGKDALAREGMAGNVWLWVVFLTGILGLLAFLVVRDGHREISPEEYDGETGEVISGGNADSGASINRVCPECGNVLATGDKYCSACGNDVSAGTQPPSNTDEKDSVPTESTKVDEAGSGKGEPRGPERRSAYGIDPQIHERICPDCGEVAEKGATLCPDCNVELGV